MIDTSTHVASTPGIMLLRVGQAGGALRWDDAGRCWRWPDPQGGQLYAWPAPAGMPSGVRLLENACVMACCASGRVLLGQGKRLGMVDLPAPGQGGRALQSQVLVTVTIIAMSFISTVYGTDTIGPCAVLIRHGWSSSTQSAT